MMLSAAKLSRPAGVLVNSLVSALRSGYQRWDLHTKQARKQVDGCRNIELMSFWMAMWQLESRRLAQKLGRTCGGLIQEYKGRPGYKRTSN